jgi:hypothetical protein
LLASCNSPEPGGRLLPYERTAVLANHGIARLVAGLFCFFPSRSFIPVVGAFLCTTSLTDANCIVIAIVIVSLE